MTEVLDIRAIQEYQQNRFPYLMIDRITEYVPGKSCKGYKNLTMNEWFFPSHFIGDPIMPGMLMLESLTQVFLMTFLTMPEYKGQVTSFLRADNVCFKARVVPGDRLEIEAELDSIKRGIAKGRVVGRVDGHLACQAELVVGMPKILEKLSPPKAAKPDDERTPFL